MVNIGWRVAARDQLPRRDTRHTWEGAQIVHPENRAAGMGEPGGLPSLGSHRVRHDWSNLAAAAKAGPSSSGDQVFGERGLCGLLPPLSLPLGFLGVRPAHLLRQMLTVQNPKKSWLAMKPACCLVDDASLGPLLPPSGSGCPCLPVSGGGWARPQPASSSQSFVLWAGLAVS